MKKLQIVLIIALISLNIGLGVSAVKAATVLFVPQGGTGAATFTDAGVILGNGTGALQVTTAGSAGQVLTSNGAGVDPTFQAAAGGGGGTFAWTPLVSGENATSTTLNFLAGFNSNAASSTFVGDVFITGNSTTTHATTTLSHYINSLFAGIASFGKTATSTIDSAGNILSIGNLDVGSAGVRLTGDGDGALTILGLGDGNDENLILNFDDTANEVDVTSGTGVSLIDFNTIGLDTDSLTVGADTVTSLDGDATLNIVSSNLRVVDVTCTDCLNATEIEDIYLLDDGDTGTGVYDFGGTTSFEITNNGTVNAAGEVTVDTTTDQFAYFAIQERVIVATTTKGVTIEDPVNGDYFGMFQTQGASTITKFTCTVVGNSTSITADIFEGTTAGITSSTTTVDGTLTCDNAGAQSDSVLTNAAITANTWVGVRLDNASGTPSSISIQVFYTDDRE